MFNSPYANGMMATTDTPEPNNNGPVKPTFASGSGLNTNPGGMPQQAPVRPQQQQQPRIGPNGPVIPRFMYQGNGTDPRRNEWWKANRPQPFGQPRPVGQTSSPYAPPDGMIDPIYPNPPMEY